MKASPRMGYCIPDMGSIDRQDRYSLTPFEPPPLLASPAQFRLGGALFCPFLTSLSLAVRYCGSDPNLASRGTMVRPAITSCSMLRSPRGSGYAILFSLR